MGPGETTICWLVSGLTCTFMPSCSEALVPHESLESTSVEDIGWSGYCSSTPTKQLCQSSVADGELG